MLLFLAGKSMTAHAVLKSIEGLSLSKKVSPAIISVNCMGLTDAQKVYKALLEGYEQCKSNPSNCIVFPCRDGVGQGCNDPTKSSQV